MLSGQLYVFLRSERSFSRTSIRQAAVDAIAFVRPDVFDGRESVRNGVHASVVLLRGTTISLVQAVQIHSAERIPVLRELRGLRRFSVSVHRAGFYIFVRQTVPRTDLQKRSIFRQSIDYDGRLFVRHAVSGRVGTRIASARVPSVRRVSDHGGRVGRDRLRFMLGHRVFRRRSFTHEKIEIGISRSRQRARLSRGRG